MSEDSFLQAILANPKDDVQLLVYSGWLEEHGAPARAEFIRIPCELEQPDLPAERRQLLRHQTLPFCSNPS